MLDSIEKLCDEGETANGFVSWETDEMLVRL